MTAVFINKLRGGALYIWPAGCKFVVNRAGTNVQVLANLNEKVRSQIIRQIVASPHVAFGGMAAWSERCIKPREQRLTQLYGNSISQLIVVVILDRSIEFYEERRLRLMTVMGCVGYVDTPKKMVIRRNDLNLEYIHLISVFTASRN